MGKLNVFLALLITVATTGFTSCQHGENFFFRDENLGCQVYYLCEDGKITQFECASGKAFDYSSSQCKDNSVVQCQESQLAADVLKRKRRQTSGIVLDFMEPVFSNVIENFRNILTFQDESLTSKFILPSILEMAGDPETKFYMKRIIWDFKAAYAPIMSQMLRQQSWNSPKGTVVGIPEHQFQTAWIQIENDVMPLIKKLILKHLPTILSRASKNTNLIIDTVERLKKASKPHSGVLMDNLVRFIIKHGNSLMSSDSSKRTHYAVSQILEDLKPIEFTALQILWEYLSFTPNILINWLFNSHSSIFQTIMGGAAEIYAVPSYA